MKHTYKISGMTCSSCQSKVQHLLSQVKGVNNVSIDLEKGEADITMEHHIATSELKNALKENPRYQLTEKSVDMPKAISTAFIEEEKSWLETYRPIFISVWLHNRHNTFGSIC